MSELGLTTRCTLFPDLYTPPNEDCFYQPPRLRLGRPGELVRSRESQFSLDLLAATPDPAVVAHQVLYRSTDALGEPMMVSGTVLVPSTPWTGTGDRPLISYAVGTRGLGDPCAPSYTLANGTDYEGAIIKSLLDLGWAVAITDYQGSGTPGRHTYMVGPSEGHAVLDIVRAAQQVQGVGLSASTPVALMGYSQGGGAAGWAAQFAGTYAPELNLKGTAIGGVPGDLEATANFLQGTPLIAFALMASLGLDAAYPELDLNSDLNESGRELVGFGDQLCLATIDGFATLVGTTAFTTFEDFVAGENPLYTSKWQARLAENKLGQAAPSAPVFQYHAVIDEIVPFDQAAQLRQTWCDLGADLTWARMEAPVEHALGIFLGAPYAAAWLAERFAGQPTESNCDEP